jgi:hypothetical protein
MPVVMCEKEAEGHKIPICCDEEMHVAGRWYHCLKCGNKFIRVDYGKEKTIVSELLEEIIREEMLLWKDVEKPIHAIWANTTYDSDLSDIPKEWIEYRN